jgi:hypothetical protein
MFICLPIVPSARADEQASFARPAWLDVIVVIFAKTKAQALEQAPWRGHLPASISYEFLLPSQAAAPARAETAISYRS